MLEKLNLIYTQSALDSRPNIFQRSAAWSIEQVSITAVCLTNWHSITYQVSIWLEQLHDRRVEVTDMFNKMKDHLRKKMKSIQIVANIDHLSQQVEKKLEQLMNIDSLGKSADESYELLRETLEIEWEAHEISEQCLKSVASCQNSSSMNQFDQNSFTMDCSIKAYQVLEQCAELQELLDATKLALQMAGNFFNDSNTALTSLITLEREVTGSGFKADQVVINEMVQKSGEISKKLLEEGSLLVEQAKQRMNMDGIR